MLLTLVTLARLALVQDTDTTFAVQQGSRLNVSNFGGEIVVRTWTQNRVRVQGTHSSRDRVDLSLGALTVTVQTEGRRGPPQSVDLDITVPQWMDVSLSGTYTDITVEGVQGRITAETVQGEIQARGGSGFVSLKSIQGSVTLEGARGHIEVSSVNESIELSDITGDVTAETTNGDITLSRVDAAVVDANTVNGDIDYDGSIKENGRYHFGTHNGDVTITISEHASASVSVSTFSGDFDSCFPVQLAPGPHKQHRFNFTIGSGSARLEAESFGGDIRLRCPGEAGRRNSRDRDKDRDHDEDHDQ